MNFYFPRIIKNLGLVLVIVITLSARAFSCSMVGPIELPRSVVDPNMYIFVGEVVGFSEPIIDPANFRGEAVGLKLRIIENIQFPYSNMKDVEIVMFSHGTDCFPEARSNKPALGTRYRLALGPASLVASQNRSAGSIRLESRVFSRIGLDEPMFGYSTTAGSVFDYKNGVRTLAEKFASPEMADKRGWLNDFLYIEASKDLIRLQKASSEKERMGILERLLYCPNINYGRLFYSEAGHPLRGEAGDLSQLVPLGKNGRAKVKPRRFSDEEKRLLNERARLESTGELNIWQR